jgi:hypothetical protein
MTNFNKLIVFRASEHRGGYYGILILNVIQRLSGTIVLVKLFFLVNITFEQSASIELLGFIKVK